MIRRLFAFAAIGFAAVPLTARDAPPASIEADAPALAPRGKLPVGTASLTLIALDRPDVLRPGPNGFRRGDRLLPIEIWYPAAVAGDRWTTYAMPRPDLGEEAPAGIVRFDGQAARDAAPAAGRYPLVVLSHGFGNRAVMWSTLAENLASKGYVVAAIEHGDVSAREAGSPLTSFLATVVNRAGDQRLVIDELSRLAKSGRGVLAHADAAKVALIGYSMGGFGALATAGAGYDPNGALFRQVPAGLLDSAREDRVTAPANLRALVAIAPWGGAAATRMWTSAALGKVTIPSLIIDGDHDDIVDYWGGVRWLFGALTRSNRHLLVYRDARHNIGMNASPPALRDDFRYRERYDEPVWRADRLLAMNAHFITAFLDSRIKGQAAAERFLDVPTPIAGDGQWPLAQGAQAGTSTAGPPGYWPGFQRRWAMGLELHRGMIKE